MLYNKIAMFIHETHFNHVVDHMYRWHLLKNNIGTM